MKTTTELTSIYPWHTALWAQLLHQQSGEQLPHALLFAGHAGMGKQVFAEALAARVLCEQPADTACGTCRACQLVKAGSHPDRHTITPEEGSKTIKTDAIRALIARLTDTAQQGGRRVVLLYPAEAMTPAAANALLKTLEEPPDNVFLFLLSEQPHDLLPTLRSRCQQFNFSSPEPAIALAWLQTVLGRCESEAVIKGLLALHENAPLAAKQAFEDNSLDLFKALLSGLVKPASAVDFTGLAKTCIAHNSDSALIYVYKIVQSFIYLKYGLNTPLDYFPLKPAFYARLIALVERTSFTHLFDFLDAVVQTRQRLQRHISLDKQLQFEALFVGGPF